MTETLLSYIPSRSEEIGRWLRILLLPTVLLVVVYVGAGFYYDTNDDVTIMLLVRGITAAQPVTNLHVYHAVWARPLAALYTWQPNFPWYDALLTGLMYVALATAFYVLEMLIRPLRYAWNVLAVELLFFVGSFAQSLVQFNFTRPAILLGAGAGLLLALPVAASRRVMWGRWLAAAILFVAGWGLRSSGADLGAVMVAPLLLMQPRRYAAGALLFLGLLGSSLTLGNRLQITPAGETYLRISEMGTNLFDYSNYVADAQTKEDSLTLAAFNTGVGPYDENLLNAKFFQRVVRPAPAKPLLAMARPLATTVGTLVKQWRYVALVWMLVAGGLVLRDFRRGVAVQGSERMALLFIAYQVYFFGLYVAVPFHFHFAPRVVEPMTAVYCLGTVMLLAGFQPLPLLAKPLSPNAALALAMAVLLAVGLDARRTAYFLGGVRHSEQQHAAYLTELQREAAGKTIVEMGLYSELSNLLLFKSYGLDRYHHILSTGGWSIYDPSQPALRRALTGQSGTAPALLALGRRPEVVWLLYSGHAKLLEDYLNTTLHLPPKRRVKFVPAPDHLPLEGGPRRYTFQEMQ